ADVFAKEPDTWLDGRDGIEGGASYHTMMGWHGVGAGLMPAERRRLTEWVSAALAPEVEPAPPPVRRKNKQNPAKPRPPDVCRPRTRIRTGAPAGPQQDQTKPGQTPHAERVRSQEKRHRATSGGCGDSEPAHRRRQRGPTAQIHLTRARWARTRRGPALPDLT